MGVNLVEVEPRALQFQVRGEQSASQGASRPTDSWPLHERRRTLVITALPAFQTQDEDGEIVAFKLQTNASKRYSVQPAQGYLRAGGSARVTILLKPGLGWSDADKFLVRAARVNSDEQPVAQVWEQVQGRIQKVVLGCAFIAADEEDDASGGADQDQDRPNHPAQEDPEKSATAMSSANGRALKVDPSVASAHRSQRQDRKPEAQKGQSTPASLEELGTQLKGLVIKNLSMAPQDKLSRAQLEELLRLRDTVGAETWARFQDEALGYLSQNRTSPRSAFGGGGGGEDAGAFARGARGPALSQTARSRPVTNYSAGKDAAQRSRMSMSSPEEVAAILSRAIEHLDARRAHEAIAAFRRARELAAPQSVQRAQVEVGLGSAYEAAGFLDNAMGCYVDAARLYDALHERACVGQVCGAIAHVYADMRDHAKAAAWFDEQLSLCGTDPEHGGQRATIMMARDHQMKVGHVAPSRLAEAKALVQDTLQSASPALNSAPDELSLPQSSVVSNGEPPSSTLSKGGIETLWEPSPNPLAAEGTGNPAVLAASSSSIPYKASGGRSSAREVPSPVSQPRIGPSSRPNYLSSTRASQAARFDSLRDRAPKQPEPPTNGPPPTYVDPVSAREAKERAKAAKAQHVRRSLEARRLRDQNRGIRPPLAKRSSSSSVSSETADAADPDIVYLDVTMELDGQTYSVALPGSPSVVNDLTVREMRERVSFVTGVELHDFELVVDEVALADSWTGGDIGLGHRAEVGLRLLPGVRPQKYIKAVRPPVKDETSRLAADPSDPPSLAGAQEEEAVGSPRPRQNGSLSERGPEAGDGVSQFEPKESKAARDRGGDSVDEDGSGDEGKKTKGRSLAADGANTEYGDRDDAGSSRPDLPGPPSRRPPPPADPEEDSTAPDVERLALMHRSISSEANALGDLLESIEESMRSRQKAEELADELERRALEVLGDDEDEDDAGANGADNDNDASEGAAVTTGSGDGDAQGGVGPASAASAAEELAARILGLEKQLAQSEQDRTKLETLIGATKAKLADLNTSNAHSDHVKKALQRDVAALRSDFQTLASETRASLTNFHEVLRRNVRALQAVTVQEEPALIGLLSGEGADSASDDGEASPERGVVVPGSAQDGPRFVARTVANLGSSSHLHDIKIVMDELAASIAKGQSAHTFVVSLGTPVALFGRKEDPSFLVEQVRAVFRALPSADFPMRVRAVALEEDSEDGRGEVVDLLNPGQAKDDAVSQASVEIHADAGGADVDVRLRGVVAVKFRSNDDFMRLFNVLLSQLRHKPRRHLVLLLEDETLSRKLVFAQVDAFATSAPQAMAAILAAAGSPRARTLVFAGLDEEGEADAEDEDAGTPVPNTAKLLTKYFSTTQVE